MLSHTNGEKVKYFFFERWLLDNFPDKKLSLCVCAISSLLHFIKKSIIIYNYMKILALVSGQFFSTSFRYTFSLPRSFIRNRGKQKW